MKTIHETQQWGIRSASFWMTLFIAVGIIFIGVRFLISPATGAIGYGIPIISNDDLPFGRIKGIRDIFSGAALLPLYCCVCAGQQPGCLHRQSLFRQPTSSSCFQQMDRRIFLT